MNIRSKKKKRTRTAQAAFYQGLRRRVVQQCRSDEANFLSSFRETF